MVFDSSDLGLEFKNSNVSLGSNCAVAYHLKRLGKRSEAYPFDWAKISINSLVQVLENKFDKFNELTPKKYSDNFINFETSETGSWLMTNPYNITFAHEAIESLADRLTHRIHRFYQLKNPTFIRLETSNINSNQIKSYYRLTSILDQLFDDYKFIVISNKIIQHPKIIWIQLDNFDSDWKYENLEWESILV